MKLFVYIVLSICLLSCGDSIDLDQLNDNSRLVVYAFPTKGDSIDIYVSASLPITGGNTELNSTNVMCTTNNRNDFVFLRNDTNINGVKVKKFCAKGKHSYGDTIRIIANATDYHEVCGQTIIPYPREIQTASLDSIFYKGNQFVRTRILIEDNNESNYYAIRLAGLAFGDDSIAKKEYLEAETSVEPLFNNNLDINFNFGTENEYYHNMYIFDDSSFKNNKTTIRFCTLNQRWIKAYCPQLFTLSKEFYMMLHSFNNICNNDFASHGLAFSFMTYSNIQGGYGCVAGYSRYDFDWLK